MVGATGASWVQVPDGQTASCTHRMALFCQENVRLCTLRVQLSGCNPLAPTFHQSEQGVRRLGASGASENRSTLVAAFLGYKQHNQGRRPRSIEAYGYCLAQLQAFLGERELVTATREELETFTGPWLHKNGVEARSRRPYVAAVREFFKWCVRASHLDRNPAVALEYPSAGRKLPTAISLMNAERVMWAPDLGTFAGVRDGAMIGLLLGCGLRVSGLVRLNASNLVPVEYEGEPRMALRTIEKGERERLLPVPRSIDLLLRVYLEHDALKAIDRALPDGDQVLFVSVNNMRIPPHLYVGERRRIHRRSVNHMIDKYGKAAGVPRNQLHPHAFRHLFGTELAEDKVDLLLRQELMGHADPKDTRIYDSMALRRKFEAIDKSAPTARIKSRAQDFLDRMGRPKHG